MDMNIATLFTQDPFIHAVEDLYYLYKRDYPEKTAISAVGNRYRLTRAGRMILFRGISKLTFEKPVNRVAAENIADKPLFVDGFNVLITLESYLKGLPVFQGVDGMTRDIAGIHSSYIHSSHSKQALELLGWAIKELSPAYVTILFDSPISMSGATAKYANTLFARLDIPGIAYTERSPDNVLRRAKGIIATSDTGIIVHNLPVFDLPGYVIDRKFHKQVHRIPAPETL